MHGGLCPGRQATATSASIFISDHPFLQEVGSGSRNVQDIRYV